ncbi:RNA-binding protein 28 isoform X2 [Gadus macrocephalus]|uniref:RNA-binding protein 28 isoform X2 n=1 Tax=Gadus macrocephalus TaxID=80720 RepID=UPI0028CBAAA2|nr:RNA-binding protein 28 isoform X2 [Gadus macrocephalus]
MPTHTLFVKHLPNSASNERLTEIFSEIGPVKHCFVVNEKGTKKCRGFGYVTFAMEDDALQAVKEVKSYDGTRISVSVAKKKIHEKRRPVPKGPPPKEGEEKEGPPKETQKKPLKIEPPKETPRKAQKERPAKPLAEAPPKQGPPKEQPQKCGKEESLKEGTPKQQQPKEEPPKAQPPKEDEPTFKGIRKSALKSKLIIRNISFKCSEDDLKQTFSAFGEVLETKIPLKPDGKMRGFGFVLFKNMSGAGKALKAMNMKEIKGRPVAVDWAIPKDKFLATQPEVPKKKEDPVKDEPESASEDEGGTEKQAAPKKGALSKKAAKQLKEASSDDEEDSDNGEESEEEEEEDEEDGGSQESGDEDDDNSSFDSDEEDYDDDDEDDDDSDDDLDRTPRKPLPSDVNEGRTIFIRNLSFDTEEEALEEALLRFGELNYIKIVLHPDTDHSKGCAFAQFKRKESAEKCIAMTQDDAENGGVRIDGRRLIVATAVTRESATQLKDKKVKVETGARNLYLAREGLIRAGTKAAEGVPEADMVKRTRFEEVKRTKLRDINVYVSKTRLCVHNLPKSVDNTKLKDICFQALSRARGVRITECRVMYDRKPEKGKATGQSLGYGFVEFQHPDHALSTIRHLNNNPDIFGPTKRPIVEFSLEDGRKLKLKEARQLKNKEHFKNRKGGVKIEFKSKPGSGEQIQPKPGAAVKIQPKPGAAVKIQPKPGAAVTIQPKPGCAVKFQPQPGAAVKSQPQPGDAVKVQPQPGDAVKVQPQPGDAVKVQPQPGDAVKVQPKTGCVVKFKTEPGVAASLPPAGQSNTVQAKRKMDAPEAKHFSGFLTKPEVEYVELEDGKKKRKTLPFPSHRGPKIRLRDKGKQQAPPKKPKGHTSRKDRQAPSMVQKPPQSRPQSAKPGKKPFRNREEDRFDRLVEKYKSKILGGGQKTAGIKRNKWFS